MVLMFSSNKSQTEYSPEKRRSFLFMQEVYFEVFSNLSGTILSLLNLNFDLLISPQPANNQVAFMIL